MSALAIWRQLKIFSDEEPIYHYLVSAGTISGFKLEGKGDLATGTGSTKKLQHFVPRFYLNAWADNGKVYCLQNGAIRRDVIRNLAAENYFYRLHELTEDDLAFLRAFIEDAPDTLRASNEQLLSAFMLPHVARRKIERAASTDRSRVAEIDRAIAQLNEELHTHIESSFQPHLTAMLAGDLGFLQNPEEAAIFYKALAVQYLRTNHIRQCRIAMEPERFRMYLRIANPLIHILANNVGRSLYADRKRHTVILVDNCTDIPLITADQPIINIAAGPKDTTPPDKFELFYPLSPKRAMLLLEPDSAFRPADSPVQEMFVRIYNLRMAAHSFRQVFSTSSEPLEAVRGDLRAFLDCFPG